MPTAPFLAPERDSLAKWGRGKQGATTYYTIPGVALTAVATTNFSANTDSYSPLFVPSPIVVDQLAFEVSTLQTGNARIGLYKADVNLQPVGAPLADSGSISTGTAGVKTYAPTNPLYLARGRYLTVYNTDAGVLPTIRNFRGTGFGMSLDTALGASPYLNGFTVARTYAAFPTPGTAWTTPSLNTFVTSHIVVFRVTQP